jgi:hypothetical protein
MICETWIGNLAWFSDTLHAKEKAAHGHVVYAVQEGSKTAAIVPEMRGCAVWSLQLQGKIEIPTNSCRRSKEAGPATSQIPITH